MAKWGWSLGQTAADPKLPDTSSVDKEYIRRLYEEMKQAVNNGHYSSVWNGVTPQPLGIAPGGYPGGGGAGGYSGTTTKSTQLRLGDESLTENDVKMLHTLLRAIDMLPDDNPLKVALISVMAAERITR